MIKQTIFHLSAKRRGCHLVTQEILEHLSKPLPQTGMLNLFVQHTSCALSINENYDPCLYISALEMAKKTIICDFSALKGKISFSEESPVSNTAPKKIEKKAEAMLAFLQKPTHLQVNFDQIRY